MPKEFSSNLQQHSHVIALPATLAAVIVIGQIGILSQGLSFVVSSFIHECGHAVFYWLSGRPAIPTHVFFTVAWDDFSWPMYLFLLSIFSGLYYYAKNAGLVRFGRFIVALLILQHILTFLLSETSSLMLCIWGGIGGEFLLSAILICAFYYKLPKRLNTTKAKSIMLGVGMFVLVSSVMRWIQIAFGAEDLPTGSLLMGRNDPHGDINRLIDQYGWTVAGVVRSYLLVASLCVLTVVGHYVYFLQREMLKRN